jgi:hypothetical protein
MGAGHAFAAGCTAMTGIEAVSNAVPSFAPPPVRTAKGVLTITVAILLVLLAGVAYLAPVYHIAAMDQAQPGYQTVLAQLAGAAIGHGVFYYLSMTALLLILCLSANTSFLGFPALCRSVALDKYLPNPFTNLGSRLVYTVGIIVLTLLAAILLIVFGGITDRLIPLFAVGAFLAFTLSQAGMVVHWRRAAPGKTSRGARMLVNAVGALSTGVATIIIVTAKFTSGAWIPLLGLPLFISIFKLTKRHYLRVQRQIRRLEPLELSNLNQPLVLLPTDAWNKLTHKAVRFGLQISRDLTAIHLSSLEPDEDETVCDNRLRHAWAESVEQPALAAGLPAPRLHIIHSPYRQFLQPLLAFIQSVKDANPQRTIVVLVPEIVKRRWWLFLLHHVRAERLKSAVLELGDPNLVIVNVPWYLQPGPLTEPEPPLSEPHEPLPQPPPHPA